MQNSQYNLRGTLLFEKAKIRTNVKNHCVSVRVLKMSNYVVHWLGLKNFIKIMSSLVTVGKFKFMNTLKMVLLQLDFCALLLPFFHVCDGYNFVK